VFEQKTSSLSAFMSLWRDEVHHQLLAKGILFIKDALSLHPTSYSKFILALDSPSKRL
jgi:hypothetical protein